jgi:hypothetical protein
LVVRSTKTTAFALAFALSFSAARAGEPVDPWPADERAQARGPLGEALERFDFGDYEEVVLRLRPIVERGGDELPSTADRREALRTYGIACTLTGRRVAAEGAFQQLLRDDPTMRLNAALVRPEAVRFFEEVRARWREEQVAAFHRSRGRRYPILNFLPPAGQFQNRQRKKGYAIGGAMVALLVTNIVTGALLSEWEGPNHLFLHHADDAEALIPVNIASFAVLLSVVVYGIVDGLVVGHRLTVEERGVEARLRAGIDGGGLAVTF